MPQLVRPHFAMDGDPMRVFLVAVLGILFTAPFAAATEWFSPFNDTPSGGTIKFVESPLADLLQDSAGEHPAPGMIAFEESARIVAIGTAPPEQPNFAVASSDDCCTESCCCRGIYFQGDGLYWGRVGTGCNQVLAIDTNLPAGSDTLLRTNDLRFNGTGGMRFLVGWKPNPAICSRCCAYELSYFGLLNWQASAHVQGAGNLAIPGDLGLASNNFYGADAIDVNYRSSLHNIEFNCIKTCCLCDSTLDVLCGFRLLTLQERFVITGTDLQEGSSSYTVRASNFLYGVQVGGRHTRNYDFWSVQVTGKGGVFLNDASQSQDVTDYPDQGGPFFLRNSIGAHGASVAALGELGITAIRPINDTWSLRLGYMALGIGGLALAPDQLDFTDTFTSGSQLQNNGWVFVHGAVIGLEANW